MQPCFPVGLWQRGNTQLYQRDDTKREIEVGYIVRGGGGSLLLQDHLRKSFSPFFQKNENIFHPSVFLSLNPQHTSFPSLYLSSFSVLLITN
jgi:hypothetical protein